MRRTELIVLTLLSLATLSASNRSPAADASRPDSQVFPTPASIKGLQVQMVDDALKLGIQHAGMNLPLNGLFAGNDSPDALTWQSGDRTFRFARPFVQSIDRQVKPLSDAGVLVYMIVLAMPSGNEGINSLVLHPSADADRKFPVGAFNTETADGVAWFRAAMEFLTHRYSGPEAAHGRVWGWIIGNEVNSHFMWHNRGPSTLDQLADGYEKAVRIAHDSLRLHSDSARVYLSFDHYWTAAHTPDAPQKSVPGRDLLSAFAGLARERGDFEWHVAWHPYHSNLFATDLWADPQASESDDTPKVTFRNLDVLARFLDRPEMHWRGKPRRIILSEQGFHNELSPEGESRQAAAYAYAWEMANRVPTIDAFIYHRHVDHAHEGGLRLGLWRNAPGSVVTPHSTKPIYDLFMNAGTDQWRSAADAYLPVAGLAAWE